jgi:hypothetical protein
MDIADINKNLSIELAIARGRKKEVLSLLRERGGENGLFERLADLFDPNEPNKKGRPQVDTETPEYKENQRSMMIDYYFLRDFYRARGEWASPAGEAKGDVIKHHGSNKTYFEEAQKRFGGTLMERTVESYLELIREQKLDYPERIKNYPKK